MTEKPYIYIYIHSMTAYIYIYIYLGAFFRLCGKPHVFGTTSDWCFLKSPVAQLPKSLADLLHVLCHIYQNFIIVYPHSLVVNTGGQSYGPLPYDQ